jgi:ADP-ribose pyrophosphatase YjhB (NUDIX family)
MVSSLGLGVWRRLPAWVREALTWCLNAHFVVGTVAIIEDADGRVLLARHTYRRRAPWALPGGWVRRGEDPADTIVRELREETGLAVRVLAPLAVQRETPRHFTIVYAARLTGGRLRSSTEVSEVRFVVPGAWPDGMRADHCVLIEQFAGFGSRRAARAETACGGDADRPAAPHLP